MKSDPETGKVADQLEKLYTEQGKVQADTGRLPPVNESRYVGTQLEKAVADPEKIAGRLEKSLPSHKKSAPRRR